MTNKTGKKNEDIVGCGYVSRGPALYGQLPLEHGLGDLEVLFNSMT